MRRINTALLFLVMSQPAFAVLQYELEGCSNAGNTIQVNRCAASLAEREEARMQEQLSRATTVLRRVEKRLASEMKPSPKLALPLQRAHATWLKYRESHCKFVEQLAMGGSVTGLEVQGCLASLNEEHANRLDRLAQGYESMGY